VPEKNHLHKGRIVPIRGLSKVAKEFIRKIIYAPTTGTRYLNLRNLILARLCQWYYFGKNRTRHDGLPIVADIGGIGKDQVKNLPGWGKVKLLAVNLYDDADIIEDARKVDKIEDGSLDGIYSSHVIEHFWWWEAVDLLNIWHRKLRPNARIEIRCPDMDWIFKKTSSLECGIAHSVKRFDELLYEHRGPLSFRPLHRFRKY